jgi:hypothetical protein
MFESVKQIIFAFCLPRRKRMLSMLVFECARLGDPETEDGTRGADGTFSIALCEVCVAAMIFSEGGKVAVSNSEVSSG